MSGTEFFAPETLSETLDLLAKYGDKAVVVAGGTDVVVDLNLRKIKPEAIVSIGRLPGWDYIREEDGRLLIGPLITFAALEKSALVQKRATALAEAASEVGGPAIRNTATLAGNLVKASPAADGAVALLGLGADVKLVSKEGERVVPLADFFVGPGETLIRPDELISEISVSLAAERSCFLKLGRRKANTLAVVSVAAALSLNGGNACREARLALGSVAPTPMRATKAEDALRGKALTGEVIQQAAQVAAGETKPITDVRGADWYRKEVTEVLVRRALEKLLA